MSGKVVARCGESVTLSTRLATHVSLIGGYVARMAAKTTAKAATPWGQAEVVEEVTLPQRVGDRRFATIVQLLETDRGERLVRFAYATGGRARRGPVTMRTRDVERLLAALREHPGLSEALAIGGGR
jgi:hypothetical protein